MTTPRPPHAGTRRAGSLALVLAALLGLAGCDPRTLFYFIQPGEATIAAPGPSLEDKKIVVVTHALKDASGEYMTLDRDLAKEVVGILRKKLHKGEVVDPKKVWDWLEDHPNWTDPEEIAKAFDADDVVLLEVETFQLQNPGDLNVLKGTAKTHVRVAELAYPKNSKGKTLKHEPKELKEIYDDYSDTEFPTRGHIPYDSGVSRGAFKSRFLKVVAAEITWHFVGHTPDDTIQDVKFNNK